LCDDSEFPSELIGLPRLPSFPQLLDSALAERDELRDLLPKVPYFVVLLNNVLPAPLS
jgi:hypothetical protein